MTAQQRYRLSLIAAHLCIDCTEPRTSRLRCNDCAAVARIKQAVRDRDSGRRHRRAVA